MERTQPHYIFIVEWRKGDKARHVLEGGAYVITPTALTTLPHVLRNCYLLHPGAVSLAETFNKIHTWKENRSFWKNTTHATRENLQMSHLSAHFAERAMTWVCFAASMRRLHKKRGLHVRSHKEIALEARTKNFLSMPALLLSTHYVWETHKILWNGSTCQCCINLLLGVSHEFEFNRHLNSRDARQY